jgi:ABC-type multidrug transport system ATPase subunit
MQIQLIEAGKRFNFDWIFKNVEYTFDTQQSYAILGPNGSGKSTLMKVIAGHLTPSKGKVVFNINKKNIDIDNVYKQISYAAPYIELIEEFTLTEAIDFHAQFKPFFSDFSTKKIIEELGLQKSKDKQVRHFSSGMKQRLKLALAILSDTSVLLLDEPTTNLDAQGANWYRELLSSFTKNRTVIVATNVEEDYLFISPKVIHIFDYK